MPPFEDHPLRYALANELHARPFPVVCPPATIVYLAIKQPDQAVSRDRGADLAHLAELLDRHGAPRPQPGATHYSGQIGRHMLKWEQHTEFVTYTAICEGTGERPFDPADFAVFPQDWLDHAPGQRITAVSIRVCERPDDAGINAALADWFVAESTAVGRVLDDAAVAAGDFRIDPAGIMRFALFVNAGTGPRRVGRVVQRLCEIETYKAMSMLGFSRARELAPQIDGLDARLLDLMTDMTVSASPAERTLTGLLSISTELETLAARSAFRFGATGAYEAIVTQRIASLREARFQGRQSFVDFMQRRYEPAMRTVKSSERRLQALADRAMRAGELLRTRVDVERSAQNQALLASMDRRSDQSLRLQHTVEGLSVVAISYYAVSLASYLLYPVAAVSGLSKGGLTAALVLPVVGAVWAGVRRVRRRLEGGAGH
ncbi:DUF3422 family protein [Pseudodonghicola xiamenensis]|uniref:Membrane-anchored protein n=1 Tax=Pseudodonghicola xiamenensis TaxID=337702 RepID=A0A8J3MBH5_9RHOB|nr:DUF3422 domain-containing protein [Pseudodonghicola xiamenensis]GHG79170.1 hypothetical protein GCM10010961_00840 [Pseudodonghicola xiamenensis]